MDSPYLPPCFFSFQTSPPWPTDELSLSLPPSLSLSLSHTLSLSLSLSCHRWLFQRTPLKKSTHRKRKNFHPPFQPLPRPRRLFPARRGGGGGGGGSPRWEAAKEISPRRGGIARGAKRFRGPPGVSNAVRKVKSFLKNVVSIGRRKSRAREREKRNSIGENFSPRCFPPPHAHSPESFLCKNLARRDFILPRGGGISHHAELPLDLMGFAVSPAVFLFHRQLG